MYLWGRGVPRDYAQAHLWYRKASDHGLAKAEYAIGDLYYYGDGVAQSYPDALIWYHKAADQNDATADDALGLMNYYGQGVPQNYSEALAWYRKAADRGDARSEYDIGYMYSHGLGVPRDKSEADRWYRKAATQGYWYAQEALGLRFPPLRPWVWISLSVLGVFCLLGLSGIFSPKQLVHDRNARTLAAGGVLAFLHISMYLFSHSKYCLFPSASSAQVFRIVTSFLGGAAITLIALGLWRAAVKTLLIASGVWALTIVVLVGMAARFDLRVLSSASWRILALEGFPAGMAVSAAIHLWRRMQAPADDASEPPLESGDSIHSLESP
jgi:Sel1 repeat